MLPATGPIMRGTMRSPISHHAQVYAARGQGFHDDAADETAPICSTRAGPALAGDGAGIGERPAGGRWGLMPARAAPDGAGGNQQAVAPRVLPLSNARLRCTYGVDSHHRLPSANVDAQVGEVVMRFAQIRAHLANVAGSRWGYGGAMRELRRFGFIANQRDGVGRACLRMVSAAMTPAGPAPMYDVVGQHDPFFNEKRCLGTSFQQPLHA